MNTQEIQEILNHLIIGITALYTIVMVLDFVVGIVHLWQKFTLNIESYTNNTTSEQSHIESSDIKKSLNLENQNQSTNRITSKPEPFEYTSSFKVNIGDFKAHNMVILQHF